MKKTGHYAAFIGLFMAAALTVTACGASAKAPDVSSVGGGSETAADSAGGGTEAAASEADHAGKNGAGTDTAEASGGAAGFQKIDTADKGNSGDTAAAGSGAGQAQPITGAAPADGEAYRLIRRSRKRSPFTMALCVIRSSARIKTGLKRWPTYLQASP